MKDHWNEIYQKKEDEEVSWYQEMPETSLKLIDKYADANKAILDVGAGNSNLIIELKKAGFDKLSALDISSKALYRTQIKLGQEAETVKWYESDVLSFDGNQEYDVWHDRAVFHFLTSSEEKKKYKEVLVNHLIVGGIVVLATFSKEGPAKCSGLEICQYDVATLQSLFGDELELKESFFEIHKTPFETEQDFLFTVWERKGN